MNWLDGVSGDDGTPEPPPLESDRIRTLVSRALLEPASLTPAEVQELAASVLTHLVQARKR